MKNYWGPSQKATLQNLERYATSIFDLQEGTQCNGITNLVDIRSRQNPLRNNNLERRPSTVLSIADRYDNRSALLSVETLSKSQGRSERPSRTLEKRMTPQGQVALITPQA